MSKITMPMPAELASLMSTSHEGVILTGPDGQPAARVVRPDEYRAMRKAFYDRAFVQVSAEDVRLALADRKRHTTEEVLKLVEGE